MRSVKSLLIRFLTWLVSPLGTYFYGELLFRAMGLRRGACKSLAQAQSILVVRLDAIGDLVLTTPFLRELRRNNPDAWITLVVNPITLNLFETCPYINEVLPFEIAASGRFLEVKRQWQIVGFARRHLWHRRFDLALSPRWDIDLYFAAFLTYFSGAKWRVGYSETVSENKSLYNCQYDSLYTQVVKNTNSTHELQRNLDIIREIGGEVAATELEVWVSAEDEFYAEKTLRQNEIGPDSILVGLGPSCGSRTLKRWPMEKFIELARWLHAEYHCHFLIIGGPGDEPLGEAFTKAFGSLAVNVIGKASLRQTAALLKRCQFYVGNDSGPTHLAAACGTPAVALFGASCHHRFHPWGKRIALLVRTLPCSPCLAPGHIDSCLQCIYEEPRCMSSISVQEVSRTIMDKFTEMGVISTSMSGDLSHRY